MGDVRKESHGMTCRIVLAADTPGWSPWNGKPLTIVEPGMVDEPCDAYRPIYALLGIIWSFGSVSCTRWNLNPESLSVCCWVTSENGF